jgi:hypothetical protein
VKFFDGEIPDVEEMLDKEFDEKWTKANFKVLSYLQVGLVIQICISMETCLLNNKILSLRKGVLSCQWFPRLFRLIRE